MSCYPNMVQAKRLLKMRANSNSSSGSHGNTSDKDSSPDISPIKTGVIPDDDSDPLSLTYDPLCKKSQSQREIASPKHYKDTDNKQNIKSMFGRVLECQDDSEIDLRDPRHVHHHEHHLYMEDHTNLQHEDAKELYGSPKNSIDCDKLKGLGADTQHIDDVWHQGPIPMLDYNKFIKSATMAQNDNRNQRSDSNRVQSPWGQDAEQEITDTVQALCEIKSFFIALKINYALAGERHRENYILREGTLAFVERYPYIRANHHSGLYKIINSEWGKPFFN
jgi:hypothetical protein